MDLCFVVLHEYQSSSTSFLSPKSLQSFPYVSSHLMSLMQWVNEKQFTASYSCQGDTKSFWKQQYVRATWVQNKIYFKQVRVGTGSVSKQSPSCSVSGVTSVSHSAQTVTDQGQVDPIRYNELTKRVHIYCFLVR